MQRAIAHALGDLGGRILPKAKEALGFLDLQAIDIFEDGFSVLTLELSADGCFIGGKEEAEAIEGDALREMLVDILRDMRNDGVAAIADVEERALLLFAADQRNQKLLQMVFQKLIGAEGIGIALFHIGGVRHIIGGHIDAHSVLEDLRKKLFFFGGKRGGHPAEGGKLRTAAGKADDDHAGGKPTRAGEAMHFARAVDQHMAILEQAREALALDTQCTLIDIDQLAKIVCIRMGFILIGKLKIMDVCNLSDRYGGFKIFQNVLHLRAPFL